MRKGSSGQFLHPYVRSGIVCNYTDFVVTGPFGGYGKLTAFDAKHGHKLWTSKRVAPTTAPVISNGRIFTGGSDMKDEFNGGFYCIEAHNGKIVWSRGLAYAPSYRPTVTSKNYGILAAVPY